MSTSNWWMYHGNPEHSGYATGSAITSANAASLKLLHDVPISGPVLSVPAIVDGYVYVGLANDRTAPGSNGGAVHCGDDRLARAEEADRFLVEMPPGAAARRLRHGAGVHAL